MARMNRKERRAQGKARFDLKGDAVAESPGGIVYVLSDSTGTAEKQVIVFAVPGVKPSDAAAELRLLATELEQQELGLQ